MLKAYNHKKIEEKWINKWDNKKLFWNTSAQRGVTPKNKKYLLFALVYTSGEGLHVGHVESKTALDILARYYRMKGKKVFFPVGWDSFGLPAENYAIKTGIPPSVTTKKSIDNFRKQIKKVGISYDWATEISTHHSNYYKWTQWLFLQLYKKGLAYKAMGIVNWCPSCQTVLANEQVVNGLCERCDTQVEQKELKQWFFKITKYKDELISGLSKVDWPKATKQQQLNWIGKSKGVEIKFQVSESKNTKDADSNLLFDTIYEQTEKLAKMFYKQVLKDWGPYVPSLKEKIEISHVGWDHLRNKTRSKFDHMARYFALPKLIAVLLDPDIRPIYVKGRDANKNVEFWYFMAIVDDVAIKVVLRSVNGGKKHFYSIMWRGEVGEKKKGAVFRMYKRAQGMDTLQLQFYEDYIKFVGELSKCQAKLQKQTKSIKVFTTRPDTIFGATYLVLAPEHPLVDVITTKKHKSKVDKYKRETRKKSELQRTFLEKDKTGVFTGAYAVNPANGKKIPIWIADYVLMGYGTGAIMAVPAHDERDFEFAKKYKLEIVSVVRGKTKELPYMGEGKIINSGKYNGLDSSEFKKVIAKWLEDNNFGKKATSYKLRDWLISRQRYWGAPIPIVYDPKGKPHPIKEEHLPWLLPKDVDFKPTGESPLKSSKEFIERTERLYGKGWRPEFDTMDTFVDSSWYFLRYLDTRNDKEFVSKDQIKKWMPVDIYIIGAEHIVLHLLYSRFFTKFLRDEGYLDFDEPFMKMRHQGMILGPDGKKMSKSKGNVINPDDVVDEYGADTLRMYEMFMGPLEASKPWDTSGVVGIRRFLGRVWNLVTLAVEVSFVTRRVADDAAKGHSRDLQKLLHKTMKKVGEDIENLKFNTAIAKLMEFVNAWEKTSNALDIGDVIKFVKILAPFAPFISEEIFQKILVQQSKVNKKLTKDLEKVSDKFISIHVQSWPRYDETLVKDDEVTIIIQVNGKVRGILEGVPLGRSEESIKKMAKEHVSRYLEEKSIAKVVYVPQKLVNFVVK